MADNFVIELKAWIPHSRVVDPEEPIRASDWLDSYSDIASAAMDAIPGISMARRLGAVPTPRYEFQSRYGGDNHTGYAGTYRVINKAKFSFDAASGISGFSCTGDCGATHRYWAWQFWIDFAGRKWAKKSDSGSDKKTATPTIRGKKTSAYGFEMSFGAANPLIMGPAPDINSSLSGMISGTNLVLVYSTDLFPSHGIRVIKNGRTLLTKVVNDPSGIDAVGAKAAAVLLYRLSSQSNAGTVRVGI